MKHSEIISKAVQSVLWACGSLGSAMLSFIVHALPVLQFLACLATITAGVFSVIASRAAIKRARELKRETSDPAQ